MAPPGLWAATVDWRHWDEQCDDMESVVRPEFVKGKPLAWGLQMPLVPPGVELEVPLRVCTVAAAMALALVVPLVLGTRRCRPRRMGNDEG